MLNGSKRERLLWVDLLNICACISVVFVHCTNSQIHNFNGNFDIPYYIGLISHSFALWAVPAFIMISGCNLLGYEGSWKHFFVRRFVRTVVPFCLWSLFYFGLFFHKGIPLKEFVERFLNGQFNNHMWFFIPLFALYLSMPFLSAFVKNSSERKLKAFVLVSFIFVSLLPFVFALLDLNCWKGTVFPMGTMYFVYAVLGYCISRRKNMQWKKYAYLGIFSGVVQFVLLVVFFQSGSPLYKILLQYEYPLNFFVSLGVFCFFANCDWALALAKIRVKPAFIAKVSSCSLGVYLLHATIIFFSNWLNLNIANPYFGFICVYLISLAIIAVMKKIPVVKIMVP